MIDELTNHIRLRVEEKKTILYCINEARKHATTQLFFQPRQVITRIIELGAVALLAELKGQSNAPQKKTDSSN